MALTVAFLSHDRTHVTQSLVACHTTTEQQFGFPCMGHGAFSYFHTRCKGVFLQRPTDGVKGNATMDHGNRSGHDARESHVHATNRIGQFQPLKTRLWIGLKIRPSMPLNHRSTWEWVTEFASELVEHVPNADVQGLSEDTVSAIQTGDHLSVAPGDIEENGIFTLALRAANLNVSNTMIDANQRNLMCC
jgi:hypothetical protein